MKKFLLTQLLLFLLVQPHTTFGQGPFCATSGGCGSPVSQNPAGTLNASTSWTSTGAIMVAGQYAAFNVVFGNTYEWSTCGEFGGTQQNSLDAELTLFNNSWTAVCFNDNSGRSSCPNAPYLGWTATYTGVVYVLLKNAWSGQCLNSPAGQAILVWRQTGSGCSPVAPATCSASIGSPANGSQHHINLSCSPVSGVSGYSFEWSYNGSAWNFLASGISTSQNIDHGENPNVAYYYRVRTYCGTNYGNYTYSSPSPIYTACDDPASPTINGATDNSLNVTLNPETPMANPSYTTYAIYCTTTGQYVQSNGTLNNNGAFYQTRSAWGTMTVTGLSASTSYCFYAKAKNQSASPDVRWNASNNACGTTTAGSCTTPGMPVSLSTNPSTNSATMNWLAGTPAGSATVTYYWAIGSASNVTYESNFLFRGTTTSLSATQGSLNLGANYYWTVKAVSSCNNIPSPYPAAILFTTSISCTTPGTPVSLSTNPSTNSTILNWQAGTPSGSATVTYYWAIGSAANVTYESNFLFRGTTTSLSATQGSLSTGTNYYWTVKAVTSCNGNSSVYPTAVLFNTSVVNTNISGTIYNYTGMNATQSLFSGANVDLLSSGGAILSSTTSNASGYFQFSSLAGSNYQIKVSSGTGPNLITGTTTGVNPGTNLSVIKLPYQLHQQTWTSNTNLQTHQFEYTLGYIFALPVTTSAFTTTTAANYLQSNLATFNSNIDSKIQALQRMLALFTTMKTVADNGAEMIQETNKEVINAVMMFLSIGEFVNKYRSLLNSGGLNFITEIWFEIQKEILIMKLFIIKETMDAAIKFIDSQELKERMTRVVDGSFAIVQKYIEAADDNEFNDGVRQHIINEITNTLVTPFIYHQFFIAPIQSNLNQAVTNIATLNYTNSTATAISDLNQIQSNSGTSHSSHSSNLVFYSALAEGLSSGAKLYSLGKLVMTNPALASATQISSILLSLGAFVSEGKAIQTGFSGVIDQRGYANSACTAATNGLVSPNGYRIFIDSVLNDSLHILYLREDSAITKMQNENYSLESVSGYLNVDSNINQAIYTLVRRINNQYMAEGDSVSIDSFYRYLAVSNTNINLRSNFSWLFASKIAGIADPQINDSLSYYSAVVKTNNIITDSVLNIASAVSSTMLSPAYFNIDKILSPSVTDTGLVVPITVISKLHSDTVMAGQIRLNSLSNDLDSVSRSYSPGTSDTAIFYINTGNIDTSLILRVNVSGPGVVEAAQNIMIHIQSLHSMISLTGSPVLCTQDSAILNANAPSGYIVKWKEQNLNSIVATGNSLVVHSGFPGIYKALYLDTITGRSYYSQNSIEITNPLPLLGTDKSIIIVCSNETADITNVYNTAGLTTEWDIPNPAAATPGSHRLIVTNSSGCKDTAIITVKQDVETWLGSISNDWHDPLNWSGNKVPNDSTHVIIVPTIFPCFIKSNDATAASIQTKTGGNFQVINNRYTQLRYNCNTLPEVGSLATVTTSPISDVSIINASGGGVVSSVGGSQVTERGICWSTTPYPTIANRKTTNGIGAGNFTSLLTGLNANTTYYVRAYATNTAGTNYGNNISFVTPPPPISDIDGNVYPVVKICNQNWIAKNLEVSHYKNGDTIPQIQDPTAWSALTTGAWCYYLNNTANGPVYGKLYNWYAVNDPRGLAPSGWHIPNNAEWILLADTCLGGASVAGGKMKTTGLLIDSTGLWGGTVNTSTNSSGFSGVPAGYRFTNGSFVNLSSAGYWWSATPSNTNNAWYYEVDQGLEELSSSPYFKKMGFSVRCVKD